MFNLSITTKLLLLRLIAIVTGGLIAGAGAIGMAQINEQSTTLYRAQVIPMAHLDELHASELKSRLDLHRIAAATTAADREKRLAGLRTTDGELAKATEGYLRTSPLATSPGMLQYQSNWAKYLEVRDKQLLPLALAGDNAEFSKIQAEVAQPLISDAADGIDLLIAAHAKLSKQRAAAADSSYHTGVIFMLGVAVAGVVFMFLLGRFIAARIAKPLGQVSAVLASLANGDLTATANITGTDEVGRMATALNQAITRTRDTITSVGASTDRLFMVTSQAAALNGEIAQRAGETTSRSDTVRASAQEVSSSVQTVASATEEMRSSIAEIASNSSRAASVAEEAVLVARETSETINRLSASSAEIDSVVRVITSIAEQTNLLALNATIEAARAGDAGKGFGVVAGEVKDLAQETARATDGIVAQVGAIQSETTGAVAAIGRILKIVEDIAQYQATIAAAVEEQTATAGEIGRNLVEASAGSMHIAENIDNVSTAATATSGSVAEAGRAVSDLTQTSEELKTLVGQFTY